MKSVLFALTLTAASISHAGVITREFNFQSSDSGGASLTGSNTENIYYEGLASRTQGSITEEGNLTNSLQRWYSGSSETLSAWSDSFIASSDPYSVNLNFVPSSIYLFTSFSSDAPPAGTTDAGYKWSLFANNSLVWQSGVELSANGSSLVGITRIGTDMGGDFYESHDYGDWSQRAGAFNIGDTNTQVNLGSFAQGSTVELRYELETYMHVAENICGECMNMGLNVGDPLQVNADAPSIQIPAVPEPETYALLGFGLLGVAVASRRQKRG